MKYGNISSINIPQCTYERSVHFTMCQAMLDREQDRFSGFEELPHDCKHCRGVRTQHFSSTL